MSIKKFLKEMVDKNGSDLFYRAGGVPRIKIDGRVTAAHDAPLTIEEVTKAVQELTTDKQREALKTELNVDFAVFLGDLDRRFRVNIFTQRNCPSIVVRNLNRQISSFEELNLPAEVLKSLSKEIRGLILLTGTMGSGKSTTIASMIDYINNNCKKHILTIEEPIEFNFPDNNCIINQREVGIDVTSYATALRAFTLQSPDVLYIANIRDQETM